MRVTLMTDASVCNQTGAGGYGLWVVSDRSKGAYGGSFNEKIKDSYIGETLAAIYSLAVAINNGHIQVGDQVLIQLDCKGAIDCLARGRFTRHDAHQAYTSYIELVTTYKLRVQFKHVKGHSSKKGNRFLANNMCDLRAKEAMRQKRLEFNYPKLEKL